mmetsp:Transcript_13393/g.28084  ORF Transcript_13393/g.28084 Transcript_13393/m.28084 type:complete len:99 (+) Transcript_13393:965-1261(+)
MVFDLIFLGLQDCRSLFTAALKMNDLVFRQRINQSGMIVSNPVTSHGSTRKSSFLRYSLFPISMLFFRIAQHDTMRSFWYSQPKSIFRATNFYPVLPP